jgi:hypothetical protein
MGLDISVYINARPADEDEIAAIDSDPAAALIALDRLEARGRIPASGWQRASLDRARIMMMSGMSASEEPREMAELLDLVIPYINPDFAARASDLTASAYFAEVADFDIHFTYSAFNRWREWLAGIAGISVPSPRSDGRGGLSHWWTECSAIEARGEAPAVRFWQLLHFSDCEGVIGPTVCKILADDFDAMAETVEQEIFEPETADWRRAAYQGWREAFRAAGNSGGWVSFH